MEDAPSLRISCTHAKKGGNAIKETRKKKKKKRTKKNGQKDIRGGLLGWDKDTCGEHEQKARDSRNGVMAYFKEQDKPLDKGGERQTR
eukprot:10601512-Ditylum_brightwellii.AAC.1